MNGKQLLQLLAEITEAERVPAKWYARHLEAAGLFPADDERATLDHAINLLLALAGARCPAEAPDAARILGNLPMLGGVHSQRTSDGGWRSDPPMRMEDIPIPVGQGVRFNELGASVRSALSRMVLECPIDAIRAGRADGTAQARWMTIVRDLRRPQVDIQHIAVIDGREELVEGSYLLDDATPYLAVPAMPIEVILTRSILHALADHWSENRIGTSAGVRRLKSDFKPTAQEAR